MKDTKEKLSSSTKDSFMLEEYKTANQRIKGHEERRYQLLVLNVTGFAAIFGLSNQIAGIVIPFALLSLLIICSMGYSSNAHEQNFNTAFVVEKYEKRLGFLNRDSAYISRLRLNKSTEKIKFTARLGFAFKKIVGFLLDPFIILMFISFVGSSIFSVDFIVTSLKSSNYFLLVPYITIVFTGHLITIADVIRRKSRSMSFYLEFWQSYLYNNKG